MRSATSSWRPQTGRPALPTCLKSRGGRSLDFRYLLMMMMVLMMMVMSIVMRSKGDLSLAFQHLSIFTIIVTLTRCVGDLVSCNSAWKQKSTCSASYVFNFLGFSEGVFSSERVRRHHRSCSGFHLDQVFSQLLLMLNRHNIFSSISTSQQLKIVTLWPLWKNLERFRSALPMCPRPWW